MVTGLNLSLPNLLKNIKLENSKLLIIEFKIYFRKWFSRKVIDSFILIYSVNCSSSIIILKWYSSEIE
jgi:hypothetical protein